jgi:hypothetical protein
MKKFYPVIFSLTLLLLAGCEKINPEEPTPGYIRINSFSLSTKADQSQGSNAAKITEAFVYVDDNLQGVYELPCRFPTLSTGSHRYTIRGGVLMNGIKATRISYPFYSWFDTTFTLNPLENVTLHPKIAYNPSTKFYWLEGFENLGISLKKSRGSNEIQLISDPQNKFEGSASGLLKIEPGTLFGEVASTSSFVLPLKETPVYLEMNYKSNHPFSVGLYANFPSTVRQEAVIALNPTQNSDGSYYWNKIYINLTPNIAANSAATDFKIYFGALADSTYPTPEIYFDNLKLVSY